MGSCVLEDPKNIVSQDLAVQKSSTALFNNFDGVYWTVFRRARKEDRGNWGRRSLRVDHTKSLARRRTHRIESSLNLIILDSWTLLSIQRSCGSLRFSELRG